MMTFTISYTSICRMFCYFMSHVFVGIFDRTQKMDETSKNLFHMRTMLAHDLISGADETPFIVKLRTNINHTPLLLRMRRSMQDHTIQCG